MSLPSGVWFPWWLSGKESAYNTGDAGSILGSRSPGERDGNPPQYSCINNEHEDMRIKNRTKNKYNHSYKVLMGGLRNRLNIAKDRNDKLKQ